MLSAAEHDVIHEFGLCTLHDHWAASLVSGEPFLEEEGLSYFDGREVTLCGFPLANAGESVASSQSRRLNRWLERGVESVLYIGPQPIDGRILLRAGFQKCWVARRRARSAELVTDCTRQSGMILTTRRFRRAINAPFELRRRCGELPSWQHLALIERFFQKRNLTAVLADQALAVPRMLDSQKVELIEAWSGNVLVGFLTLRPAFSDLSVAYHLFSNGTAGVADFLLAHAILRAQETGAKGVNLGSSPNAGIYRFKLKWHGVPEVPPYYGAHWARGSLARRHFVSWGTRLLRLPAPR